MSPRAIRSVWRTSRRCLGTTQGPPTVRVRFHIIRNARIENVGKSQSCMVSKLRIIWKQTVVPAQGAGHSPSTLARAAPGGGAGLLASGSLPWGGTSPFPGAAPRGQRGLAAPATAAATATAAAAATAGAAGRSELNELNQLGRSHNSIGGTTGNGSCSGGFLTPRMLGLTTSSPSPSPSSSCGVSSSSSSSSSRCDYSICGCRFQAALLRGGYCTVI